MRRTRSVSSTAGRPIGPKGTSITGYLQRSMQARLLLVPAFSELQWTIKPMLEQWAEVASFDPPGVGDEPVPEGLELHPDMPLEARRSALTEWRRVSAVRGLEEVDRLGWERFFVVADGEGIPTGLRIAAGRLDGVMGLALGHAALSRSTEGERP